MEERLRGLVHLLAARDEDDIAFLKIAKSRFNNHLIIYLSMSGRISQQLEGSLRSKRLIDIVEQIEALVNIEEEDGLRPSVLVEVWVPVAINAQVFELIFQIIDTIQRVVLHFDLRDRAIKLFFVKN